MTKLIFRCLIVWLSILCLTGCGLLSDTSPDFAIRVCGTEGLKFSGHYSIVGTNTLPEPITAQGVIPMEYKGRGTIALCSFRKLTEEGSLKVEILRNGKAILESETNIPYGFVSIKTPIPEKDTIIAQLIRKVFGNE